MKRLLTLIFLSPLLIGAELKEERFVSELTISELKEIVRTMSGRAKVNLKVEGEVIAKMECEFKDTTKPNVISEKTKG